MSVSDVPAHVLWFILFIAVAAVVVQCASYGSTFQTCPSGWWTYLISNISRLGFRGEWFGGHADNGRRKVGRKNRQPPPNPNGLAHNAAPDVNGDSGHITSGESKSVCPSVQPATTGRTFSFSSFYRWDTTRGLHRTATGAQTNVAMHLPLPENELKPVFFFTF
jgi:hypothetical protein